MAAERNLLAYFFEHRVAVLRALHGGEHVSRRNGADPHLWSEFERHGTREFDDSGFGRVVVGVVGISHDPVGGCGLQDDAAAALPHVARCSLGDVENAGQVDGEHLLPFFRRDV